jgi:outer membrane lipoprotein-sorting protein
MEMKFLWLSLFLGAATFANDSNTNAGDAKINTDNKKFDQQLKSVEDYFNSIKTLKATFLQNNNNNVLSGILYIQKPLKMRADYGSSAPLLILSDGTWMINYDKELEQSSYAPLSSSPAEIMLKSDFSFKNVKVLSQESINGILKITMTKPESLEGERITFVFTQSPLELREWVAIDPQGNVIRVSLNNIEKNIPLQSSLFTAPK